MRGETTGRRHVGPAHHRPRPPVRRPSRRARRRLRGRSGPSTFAAVAAGGGGWAMAVGAALVLAELPWFLAFGARWRLLDDALRGVPFAWRGDRAGVWAIAPVSGALAHAGRHRRARLPDLRWPSSPACSAPRCTPRRSGGPSPATSARSCSTSPSSSSASAASPTPASSRGQTPQHCDRRCRANRTVKGTDPSSNGVSVEAEGGLGRRWRRGS